MRLVTAAGRYWWLSGHKAEGIKLAIEALGVRGEVDDRTRATACAVVAYFTTAGIGDLRQPEPWTRTARQLAVSWIIPVHCCGTPRCSTR